MLNSSNSRLDPLGTWNYQKTLYRRDKGSNHLVFVKSYMHEWRHGMYISVAHNARMIREVRDAGAQFKQLFREVWDKFGGN